MQPGFRQEWFVLGKVPPNTSILCIGAHPDDIEGGCVNTVLNWVRSNARVTFAFSTGGEYGLPRKYVRFYGKRLRAIRAREMRQAVSAYGTNPDGTPKIDLRWLGFIDGFIQVTPSLLKRLRNLLLEAHLIPTYRQIGIVTIAVQGMQSSRFCMRSSRLSAPS